MAMTSNYETAEPTRAEINALEGPTLLELGTSWCGYCSAAQPLLASALAKYPQVTHRKIEDGKGRPLGRSFRVTLWPTLVFLKNGAEVSCLVRPRSANEIAEALASITE